MNPIADAQTSVDATTPDLAKAVRLFLTANRRGFREVSVWAESGTVRLCGPVHSFFLRQMAVTLAKKVTGVHHVIDDLEVDPMETVAPRARGNMPADALRVEAYVQTDCEREN
jgi:osmotically-inducible protein OsmY